MHRYFNVSSASSRRENNTMSRAPFEIIITRMTKVLIQNILLKTKNTESTERRKTSFPKEWVENTGLYKPVQRK